MRRSRSSGEVDQPLLVTQALSQYGALQRRSHSTKITGEYHESEPLFPEGSPNADPISAEEGQYAEAKPIGLFGLFRYGSVKDLLLMVIGLFFSMVTGASLPCLGLVFGDMTNMFIYVARNGFKNSTMPNGLLNITHADSLLRNTSIDDDGITLEEFTNRMNDYAYYYVYIAVATLFASFVQAWCWETSCERQVQKLRQHYFSQILRQDVAWCDQNIRGDLTNKLTDDIERIRDGIGNKFAMVVQYITTFVSGILVGLYADWWLTVILFVVGPFILATTAFLAKFAAGSAEREQLKYSVASRVAAEVLGSLRTVAAFGGEEKEAERYKIAVNDGRKIAMMKYYSMSGGLFFVNFILYSGYGFAFWTACFIIKEGHSTPGDAFTVLFSVMMGSYGIGNILPFINAVSTAIGAARNVYRIIDRVPKIDSLSHDGVIPSEMEGHVVFEDVSFSYPIRSNVPVLRGMKVEIKPGQRVAFVGPSGAGKSTVLNLLLRFYDPIAGQIKIDGRNIKELNLKWLRNNIGLVSQEPMLFDVSILDNIRYGKEDATIEEVQAAALMANAHSFISELPGGYDTLVGERGTQLSRGQKQRIAIARALVRQPKVLLLDEATSALDSQSESILLEALERAMRGRTIIVTAKRMLTTKNFDIIHVMQGGKIVESGNHDTLMSAKGVYFQLPMEQIKEEEVDGSASMEQRKSKESLKAESELAGSSLNLSYTSQNEHYQICEYEDKKGSLLKRLLKLNCPEWYMILIGLVASIFAGSVHPVFAYFFAEIFNTFTIKENEEMEESRAYWSVGFVIFGAVSGLFLWIWNLSMVSSSEYLIARVRQTAMENTLKQEISWFDYSNFSIRKIITRLSRDAAIIKHVSWIRLGQLCSAGAGSLIALVIAFMYSRKLGALLFICFLFLIISSYYQVFLMRRNIYRDLSLMDNAGKLSSECVQNLRTVQALGMENNFVNLYMEYLKIPYEENKKQALVYAVVFSLAQCLIYLVYSIAFKWGSMLIGNREMHPVQLYRGFFAVAFTAVATGQSLANVQNCTRAIASSKKVFQLIDKKSLADPLDMSGQKPTISGKIKFENVSFSYPTRKNDRVLKNFDLEIEAGETVALVGESGCDISTVISLLERFYNVDKGNITIDGIDIQDINLRHLRSQMGLVTQEPVLFACSVKDNVLYGGIALDREPTPQEVIAATKLANIHEFISSLSEGYNTECGERCQQITGGEKLRIAIARALVRNPKILLIDEATSALDAKNEKIVQQALDNARSGRTCILVAHRLSTIQNADKVALIRNGKVAELGKHEELMARNGIYAKLMKRQLI